MTDFRQRLVELGIELPPVAAPLAAYVPALRVGDFVYTSGQLPSVAGVLLATGKVGGAVSPTDAAYYARICALNALAAVGSAVDLNDVSGVVKVVGYVASEPDFTGQPAVLNGASTLLGEIFGDAGRHARSAVGVAVLPMDAPVELELIVHLG